MGELVEIEPGRWRFVKPTIPPARSALSCPHVISDIMPATEQVDGKFYTSKSQFRAVGKALGLIEVGTSKFPAHERASASHKNKTARKETLQKVISQYKQGRRPRK